ncbi:hypothetical protein V5799_010185 [Amblyomma americanum]|uniref:Uncharacterized protein n=1 Tax=Amblyomma americanum TaxID=6943 RepID=A0AAQ4F9V8_AMBAM
MLFQVLVQLLENIAPQEVAVSLPPSPSEALVAESVAEADDVANNVPDTTDKSFQVVVRPPTLCKGLQANVKAPITSRKTQTQPQGVSVGVQVGSFLVDAATQVNFMVEPYEEDDSLTDCEPEPEHHDAIALTVTPGTSNNPTASLRMLSSIGVEVVTDRTFFNIQKIHLWPAIDRVWRQQQEQLLKDARGKEVALAGDGRADSPGFSAKFGTYSLLDVQNNKLLNFELVQSNEVGGSCYMELEGLKRGLQFLENQGITVKALVTDRHIQIKAHMRRERPGIQHKFDVWHVAKGVFKKVTAISKRRDCKDLQLWAKSIQNHLYWSAASSHGHSDHIVPKWLSLLNHIRDVHVHNDALFPACLHDKPECRMWLKKESKAFEKLNNIATSKVLLADMPKLSTKHQTYGLETFHSLLLHFAPKNCQYSYLGMKARTQLAVMHYNENCARSQACRLDGAARWNLKYPKATGGKATACPVKEQPTYGYVQTLLNMVMVEASRTSEAKKTALMQTPPPLSSQFSRVPKEEAVKQRKTRFNK